ncbi:hypothetical protein HMPREF9057_03058 [Actinomyces sp. oral taxon 171 str. F0337]|nr:hypothetical protein HMPREF9057_03058 [Actinomyces sp. oral taxon 171 str. F0337]
MCRSGLGVRRWVRGEPSRLPRVLCRWLLFISIVIHVVTA